MLSCMHPIIGDHRGQGKSWDSGLILAVKLCGLADEAVGELVFMIFHSIFMHVLNDWYLVAFHFTESWFCG